VIQEFKINQRELIIPPPPPPPPPLAIYKIGPQKNCNKKEQREQLPSIPT
jgi:hypothetical protein